MRSELARVSYFRNFIFGIEDSLVSTVGLLSGIAIVGVPRSTIFISGIVLIFVEAFSMGAGSVLSEQSAEGFESKTETLSVRSLKSGAIMFFSYFAAGFIPLFPYLILPAASAFYISMGLTLIALFMLGVVGGRISGISVFKNGLRMFLIGGLAISIGVIVGTLASQFII
ncbi:MAG: VIT1/CCC1 transporter family protein [Candidatus Colwellbacteria bacterium]|nr:VIT1/CCC1 transporter family protein [Candidatus Colwellbacteria bacterium]